MNKTEDSALNKRLAELLGYEEYDEELTIGGIPSGFQKIYRKNGKKIFLVHGFTPSTDKAQAMELLKDFELSLEYVKGAAEGHQWQCWKPMIFGSRQTANTPEETITRAVIKMLEAEQS